MAKRTLIELVGFVATWWGNLTGPLIPPGKTYAQSQAYEGFQEQFDACMAAHNVTEAERADLIADFSFPAL